MTDTTLEQARAIATELDDFKAPIYLRARCTLRNLADQVDRLTAERDALRADAECWQAAYEAGLAEGRKSKEVWIVSNKTFSVCLATEAQADKMIAASTPAMGLQKLKVDVVQTAPEPTEEPKP